MIARTNHADPRQLLEERARSLMLPIWWIDGAGSVVSKAAGWNALEPWLHAPALTESMMAAAASCGDESEVCELSPGCWLVVLPANQNRSDDHRCVTLVFTEEFLRSPLFASICRSGGASEVIMRAALGPIVRSGRTEAEHLAKVLAWMQRDLVEVVHGAHAIENFSKQLVDTYEQMSLLYRIAECMNGLEDPRGFVHMACDLLQDTLEFRWIGIRFTSLRTLGRGMTNELILSGEIPCSHTRFDRLAGELALMPGIDDRPIILEPHAHELAALVNSETFVNPLICNNNLAGLLLAGNKGGEDPDISSVDMQLVSATADYVGAFVHNSSLYSEQRTMFLGIVRALSASIDAKDRYTRGHSERVAHLATELALATGFTEEQAERVRLAGILHDMGKIGVPEAVLLKPGKLTDEEFDAIKRHPTIGYNILKDIEPLEDVLPGVLYHHERWDGRGYPHGLRGANIPLLGRILAVADAFDAMSSDRAYRPRIAREKVLMEMRSGAGTQWDAELVKAFLKLDFSKYDSMIDRHAAQSAHAA
ncbi:MAG: HD-GYP domain-containing protein [Phycisphaerales bacterium]|nr:HD-GYP domain-containing protein [Phycisphaerae bacterium]NNF42124.1 HD-GYP domain-containing protein [Phycisphaerales bacterium]NNM24457.1 HD-GYP domain-containing protein [Phycisphaerales bacterium]